jgi:short-subunit dehydrogenase involved in D-alanine esterification of teichoic acids
MQLIYGLLPLLTTKQNAAIVNISSGLGFAPKKICSHLLRNKICNP